MIQRIVVLYDTCYLAVPSKGLPFKTHWENVAITHCVPIAIEEEIKSQIESTDEERRKVGRAARGGFVDLQAAAGAYFESRDFSSAATYQSNSRIGADSRVDKQLLSAAQELARDENTAVVLATNDGGIKVEVLEMQRRGKKVFVENSLGILEQQLNEQAQLLQKQREAEAQMVFQGQQHKYKQGAAAASRKSWKAGGITFLTVSAIGTIMGKFQTETIPGWVFDKVVPWTFGEALGCGICLALPAALIVAFVVKARFQPAQPVRREVE